MHAVSVSGLKNNPAEALSQSKQDMAVMFNRDHPDAALSDGLACFRAAATADCSHGAVVTSGKQPNDLPEFRWINS